MAVCLEYQSVYASRRESAVSLKFHVFAALLLLAALVTRVTLKIQATQVGYAIAHERARTVELDMERRELELERSVLLRPDSLIRAARKLGLEPLNVEQARRLKY